MSRAQMITYRDSNGEVVWFFADCAKCWKPDFIDDSTLYFNNGDWVLDDEPLNLLAKNMGKLVGVEEALRWFVRNERELPQEIAEFANERKR